jgi:hypothetical protein
VREAGDEETKESGKKCREEGERWEKRGGGCWGCESEWKVIPSRFQPNEGREDE